MTQGIYEIVNWQDGKATSYIGSSCDIERRWVRHRSDLHTGRHGNPHLQAMWHKYGEDAFAFNVLEEVSDDMLLLMEQEYLDDHFDRGHCCNIATTAGPGGPVSEETKRKITAAHMGHEVSEQTRHKLSKPYPAFIHLGTSEIILGGRNLSAMCDRRGLAAGHMNGVKNGKRKSHQGWILLKGRMGAS